MNKWLSLRRWKDTLVRVYRLLKEPRISLGEKLVFIIPVGLYWVLPDILPIPFLPIDDIAVTLLAAGWFAGWMERKHGIH